MTIWFYSDPHFGGSVLPGRPFATIEEHDETMIERHNRLVKPTDHVYCLGDFAMRKADVERVASRLNGHKRLVLGNHDIFDTQFYLQWFKKICAIRKFDHVPIWFTHMPIAAWSHGTQRANVHGHVHFGKPLLYRAANPDEHGFVRQRLYINLSVERTNYQPVSLEMIKLWVDKTP